MKILAASVVFAMSGAANAAIVTGANDPGELFLTVWDSVGQQSYGLDLGVYNIDIMTNKSGVLTYDLSQDANYSTFLNNTGLVYQITSDDQVTWDYESYGMFSTARDGVDATRGITNDNALQNMMAKLSDWAISLNTAAGDQRNPSLNLSAVSLPGESGYYDSGFWGPTNGGMGFISAQSVGTSVDFIKFNLDATDDWTILHETMPNVWTLGTDGMLTYAPVSAVPVPAAVWLFGSGLLGLVSVARRRKA